MFKEDPLTTKHSLRLALVFVFVLGLTGLLISRLVWLQIYKHDYYVNVAESNRTQSLITPPHRGIIFDRNGTVLAKNYSAYTLEIDPTRVLDIDATITRLQKIIELLPADIQRYKRNRSRYETAPIKLLLTEEEVAKFAAYKHQFPGVEIGARLFRSYPEGETAAHVIGYVGRVSQSDTDKLKQEDNYTNYIGTEHIGKEGIERSYEYILHGQAGSELVEITAAGNVVRTIDKHPPRKGNNLFLSIDIQLQKIAEQAFGNQRGALVAIEPSTGDILAFVSRPSFNPNLFATGISLDDWAALRDSPYKPMMNRPLYGTYPIGSTYKPFVALAAMEKGVRTKSYVMFDPGYFEFGNRRYRNAGEAFYGNIDVFNAIRVSSDTFFYSIGNDLGVDFIHDFMQPFGFGKKTGIDLYGEKAGILPSTQWKRENFKNPLQQVWFPGENLSTAVGQGYNSFTILQLAQATAVLVNNGRYMKPHLVKRIQDSTTGTQSEVVKEPSYTIPLSTENVEYIKSAMASVTRQGTARGSFAQAPYFVAGKTGTAQVIGIKQGERYVSSRVAELHRDHALFMGFATHQGSEIALALIVENGGWGSSAAAPIARKVFDYWLIERLKP